MILYEWFTLFVQEYKAKNVSSLYKELFVQNNFMNDLLEYSTSMKVFDNALSHPLMFHLSIFCKFINLIYFKHDESNENQEQYAQVITDLFDLWKHASDKQHLFVDYCQPISDAMNSLIDSLESNATVDDIALFDDVINHLQQSWSPYFI